MAVETADADGMVGRHGIDPVVARQFDRLEEGVVPFAVQDPLPFREAPRLFADAADELLLGRGVSELDARERKSAVHEVNVAVGESREDHPAAEIDRLGLRACGLPDFERGADGDDLALPRGQRLGRGRAGSRVRNFALMKILSAMFVPPEHEIRAARAAARPKPRICDGSWATFRSFIYKEVVP